MQLAKVVEQAHPCRRRRGRLLHCLLPLPAVPAPRAQPTPHPLQRLQQQKPPRPHLILLLTTSGNRRPRFLPQRGDPGRARLGQTDLVEDVSSETVHPCTQPQNRPPKMFQKIRKKVWKHIMLISNMSQNFGFKFVTELKKQNDKAICV